MPRIVFTTLFAAAATLAVSAAQAAPAHHDSAALARQAKVDMAQARAIALKARPGQIVDEELEKEGGGSGLRYSFDVKAAGKTYEVGVDAMNGRVLENGSESAAKEANEARTEGPEAKHPGHK